MPDLLPPFYYSGQGHTQGMAETVKSSVDRCRLGEALLLGVEQGRTVANIIARRGPAQN